MEEKQKHKGRVFLLVGVIIAVFVVFALRLMKYQIVDAEKISGDGTGKLHEYPEHRCSARRDAGPIRSPACSQSGQL